MAPNSPRKCAKRSAGDRPSAPTRRSARIAERKSKLACVDGDGAAHTTKPGGARRRNAVVAAAAGLPQLPVPDAPSLKGSLFYLLPPGLLDAVLDGCCTRELAALETTCRFFRASKMIQNISETRLRAVPRAKGTLPDHTAHENHTSLLHFILSQSAAAAQATALAFGANHSAALLLNTSDTSNIAGHHNMYTSGRGFYGQLGHRDFESTASPKELCIGWQASMDDPTMEEEITPAVVACGTEFTASITRRGQLLTWGLGSRGELGHELPNAGETTYPMRALLSTSPSVRIVSVACGSSHTLAIAETGTVWSCGRNNDGQLGNSTFVDGMLLTRVSGMKGFRVVSCAAGGSHSMALASDGSLFTWGGGRYGQLGHRSLHAINVMMPQQPIVLATPQKIAVLEPSLLKPWKRVTSIAAGIHHSCAVTVGGALLVFGRGKHGQLGTNDTEDRWQPTEVELGHVQEPEKFFRAVQVVAGLQHTLALIAHRGKVKAFASGANVWGQLGLGNQAPAKQFVPIPALQSERVVALQAGGNASAAICEGGKVFVWGRNDLGSLGLGDNVSRWAPTLLKGLVAVHPDRTLRKSKRTAPRMRLAAALVPPVPAPAPAATPAVLAKLMKPAPAHEETGTTKQQQGVAGRSSRTPLADRTNAQP